MHCEKSMKPEKTPELSVANTGVLVVGWINDRHLKSNPSLDMAYRTLGSGNIPPNILKSNITW